MFIEIRTIQDEKDKSGRLVREREIDMLINKDEIKGVLPDWDKPERSILIFTTGNLTVLELYDSIKKRL